MRADASGGVGSVDVVVPTYRRPDALSRCLRGLAAQSQPPAAVVVVVRDDDAATWEALRRADDLAVPIRPVEVTEPGVVAALTAGVAAATAPIVAITDDDVVPRPDWLRRLTAPYADPAVGGVGGRDVVHVGDGILEGERPEVGRIRWYGRVVGGHHLGVGRPRDVDVLKGANMSWRREVVQTAGFDGRLRGRGAQVHWELGLALAARAAGRRLVYDPAAVVDHYPAERFDEDRRGRPEPVAVANAVHNETYLLLRWLPPWRRAACLAFWILAGTRASPGLAAAAERLVRGRDVGGLAARVWATARGRAAGVRTYRAWRSGRA